MVVEKVMHFCRALFMVAAVSFAATASDKAPKENQTVIASGGFVHSVYFWLKNPENEQDRKAFEKHLNLFIDNSLYVKSKFIGTVAPSERDVVDSTYTYALILTFDSKADQDKYQSEPVHLKFVEDAQHLWEKVIVYDAFNTL
ncbi:Dabb family protein [Thalassotalea agarivorans]|uniref:Stress responsive A/B Barrel Domain n=1 Tax=Thalassotalea agarivorans TaxID=349064 RepID=A0A1I0E401_THASX|nr:Dabb family protein [Thalassotalea agarivorans]SET39501.1 Stress responsive A/B Barrel Domain [Thalassotalea agarivorans]